MKRSKRLRIARRIETSYPVKKVRRNHFVRQIHRPRYNWMICIGCSLLIFVTMGLVSSGFSVYFPFLARTYGLSNTQVSLLTTVRCAASFFSMLIVGPFYKWTGLRRGVTIASCSAFLSFIVFGFSKGFIGFCAASAFAGVSYGMGSMIPVSILINRWFEDRRSFAMGICAAGSGVATIVASPAITYLISRTSLSATFFIEAAAVMFLAAYIFSIIKDSPAEMGLEPYRTAEHRGATHKVIHSTNRLSRVQWVLVIVASLIVGALANPGYVNIAMLYATEHYNSADVAFIVASLGLSITAGKLFYGYVTDNVGGFRSNFIFTGILVAGLVCASFATVHSTMFGAASMLILGIGFPISTIGPSVWAADLAEPEAFAKVIRRSQVFYAGGAFAFSSMPGILADRFGSYSYAYRTFAVMAVVMLIALVAAYRMKNKRT